MIPKVETITSPLFWGITRITCLLVVFFLISGLPVLAAGPVIPNYIDPRERIAAPDLTGRARIRFLTTVDFPPFNFIDQTGKLAGFHVDLARAICNELGVLDKCQIQALPWEELDSALQKRQGEAVIAGLAMTEETRKEFRFTRAYLELPARFVINRDVKVDGEAAAALASKRIGVMAESAHEAMLRAWFPEISVVTFDRSQWLHEALREGSIDGAFGDGVQLSFWLSSGAAQNCCRFFGGPYLSRDFLGEGLAIAVAPSNKALAGAINHALAALNRDGRFAELYLRWFPNGIY